MKQIYALAILAVSIVAARPANDWSKPCFHGECAYDIMDADGSGTLKIAGPSSAITDITDSAGWIILNCDPHALAQDIRLVCKSTDEAAAGCSHLFEGSGAEHKVVRLPESCGGGPFARVVSASVAHDQSIPSDSYNRITRRGDELPKVHILSVDMEWDKVDTSKLAGPVTFAFIGANRPGFEGDFDASATSLQRRGGDEWVENALEAIGKIDVDKSVPLPNIEFSKDSNLYQKEMTCGPAKGTLSVDVHGSVTATVSVGIVASGQLAPPKVTKVGVTATLNGGLEANLHLASTLTGDVTIPRKVLFSKGETGKTFAKVVTLTPTVKLEAYGNANVGVNADADVGLDFKIDKAQLVIPSSAGKSGGKFVLEKTPLKIKASPGVTGSTKFEGHIVPSVSVGLKIFTSSVNVNLEIDAFTKLDIEASANARRSLPPYGAHTQELTERAVPLSACANFEAGIHAHATADGKFFSFFDKSTNVNVFSKTWAHKKCVGNAKREISSLLGRSVEETHGTNLGCPAKQEEAPVSLEDETVSPNDMKPE